MKSLALLLALLAPLGAAAKIQVTALTTNADSTEREATLLTQSLKALGVKSYTDRGGQLVYKASGSVTITNGAACDNGHQTYSVTLSALGEDGKEIQKLELQGEPRECTVPSKAERLKKLLDQWGGSILAGDCGLGHCWEKIDSIECRHFDKDATTPAFDSCSVQLSSGQ